MGIIRSFNIEELIHGILVFQLCLPVFFFSCESSTPRGQENIFTVSDETPLVAKVENFTVRKQKIEDFWTGRVSGTEVKWTSHDLVLETQDWKRFVFATIVESDLQSLLEFYTSDSNFDVSNPLGCKVEASGDCYYQRRFSLRFLVGDLIGFLDEYEASAGDGVLGFDSRFTVIRVRSDFSAPIYDHSNGYPTLVANTTGGKQVVSLEELATQESVLVALQNNKVFLSALSESGIAGSFDSLDELKHEVTNANLGPKRLLTPDGKHYFPNDFLTRFYVESFEEGNINVKLLVPGSRIGSVEFSLIIGIEARPTPAFKNILEGIEREGGFLGAEANRKFSGKATTFRYEYANHPK